VSCGICSATAFRANEDNIMADTKELRSPRESRREAWARWIASQLVACSLDELRVIGVRVARLARARSKYGPLNLASDPRDFRREAAEENVDRAFYLDCLLIARQDEEGEGLYCIAADQPVAPVETGLAELRDAEPIVSRTQTLDFALRDLEMPRR
jgi:hypothetical protein